MSKKDKGAQEAPVEEQVEVISNEISAKAKVKDENGKIIDEREGSVIYDFGTDLAAAESKFGAPAVFNMFRQASVVALQSRMRAHLGDKEKNPADLQSVADAWKPGVTTRIRKSAAEKVQDLMSGMDPEDIQKLIAQMQEAA